MNKDLDAGSTHVTLVLALASFVAVHVVQSRATAKRNLPAKAKGKFVLPSPIVIRGNPPVFHHSCDSSLQLHSQS
jgi:hypothetical protein